MCFQAVGLKEAECRDHHGSDEDLGYVGEVWVIRELGDTAMLHETAGELMVLKSR